MLYFASDLHIEYIQNYNYVLDQLKNRIFLNFEDILVLAGDTFIIRNDAIRNQIFDILSEKFKDVYILIGNHELYDGYDASLMTNEIFKKIRKNVYLVNNHTFEYNNYKILLTTLFSHISYTNAWYIQRNTECFSRLKYNKENYNVDYHNYLHEMSLMWLKRNFDDKNNIVITHYAPTRQINSARYMASRINENFTTELFKFIEEFPIKYWVYGHTHYNKDVKLAGTEIISNQMGYYSAICDNFEFFREIKV